MGKPPPVSSSVPTWFCLLHPLDDFSRVMIKQKGQPVREQVQFFGLLCYFIFKKKIAKSQIWNQKSEKKKKTPVSPEYLYFTSFLLHIWKNCSSSSLKKKNRKKKLCLQFFQTSPDTHRVVFSSADPSLCMTHNRKTASPTKQTSV